VFLNAVLDPYREHVSKVWSDESTDQVEAEHRELLKLYDADMVIRSTINCHTSKTTFNDAWSCAPKCFERLRSFRVGLATVFANKASVESDFSIFKWELDESSTALMHLSLEGIFQAKHRALLHRILRNN
jgi:hypothetical protein